MGNGNDNLSGPPEAPRWMAIVGVIIIIITIFYIMTIALLLMLDIIPKYDNRVHSLISILSFFTMTVGSGSISGWATFNYKANWPLLGKITATATGGIAAGAIAGILVFKFMAPDAPPDPDFINQVKDNIKIGITIKSGDNTYFNKKYNYSKYKKIFNNEGIRFETLPSNNSTNAETYFTLQFGTLKDLIQRIDSNLISDYDNIRNGLKISITNEIDNKICTIYSYPYREGMYSRYYSTNLIDTGLKRGSRIEILNYYKDEIPIYARFYCQKP